MEYISLLQTVKIGHCTNYSEFFVFQDSSIYISKEPLKFRDRQKLDKQCEDIDKQSFFWSKQYMSNKCSFYHIENSLSSFSCFMYIAPQIKLPSTSRYRMT